MDNGRLIYNNISNYLDFSKRFIGSIILFSLFISVFLHKNSFIKDNSTSPSRQLSSFKDNLTNNDSIDSNIEEQFIELPLDDEMQHFFKSINYFYVGTWKSNNTIKDMDHTEGTIIFKTSYYTNNQSFTGMEFKHQLVMNLLLYDDKYIDKWIDIRINGPMLENYSIFDFQNQTISGKNQLSKVYNGEILEKKSDHYCIMNTTYSYNKSSLIKNFSIVSEIKGKIRSGCFINIDFEVKLNLNNEEEIKGRNYFIFSTIIALSQVFNSIWLYNRLTKYQSHANCISIITICQSIVWNSYGCLCHFFIAIIFDKYIKFFGFPAFIYFINFTIFEIRLLYKTWANQNINNQYDTFEIRRKMMKYYVIFYIFIFLSLFLVTKFYFIKSYIFVTVLFTWIPQIIYNSYYNNRTSLPLINVILMSLNKLMIPAYFRGCPQNFFHISADTPFIFLCFCVIFLEITVLYLQNLYGPRFFLPKSLNTEPKRHNYYKTKQDLIAYPELEKDDCVICLIPIMYSENCLMTTSNINDFNLSINQNSNFQSIDLLNSSSRRKKLLNTIKMYLFNFHEVSSKNNSGEYMITPCNHIYHSDCLEGWIKQNRICPTCRNPIPNFDA